MNVNSGAEPKYVLYILSQKADSLRNINLLKFKIKTELEMIAKIMKSRVLIVEKPRIWSWG